MFIDEAVLNRFEAIVKELRDSESVLTVPMNRLKELYGGYRLKKYIRRGIADHLQFKGIGFVGKELPTSQSASVRLYVKNTPIAKLIEAVECEGSEGDEKIRRLARNATEALSKDLIHELVFVSERLNTLLRDFQATSRDIS